MGESIPPITMKCLVVLALVGAAAAYPRPDGPPAYGPPPPKYAPAPAPKYKPAPKPGYKPEEYPPQPYQFEYGVSDQYTGTNFQAVENQNDAGSVVGSYKVNLPDGRVQTVTYTADDYGGFVADVKYEGTPQYPPEPAEGYGNSYKAAKPKYAPAPPPKYTPAN